MSVSDNTNENESRRKSYISTKSRTNSFLNNKHTVLVKNVPQGERGSLVHLSTIQENRHKKMLEVTQLDTMK